MQTTKPTIAALMGVVLITAVGFAALCRPSQLTAAFLFSAATALLTIAIVGALHARGSTRAFWSGFAIGGWVYLGLQYAPGFDTQIGPYTFPVAALDVLYDTIAPSTTPPPPGMVGTGSMLMMMSAGNPTPVPVPVQDAWNAWSEVDRGRVWAGTRAPSSFFRIGHSLLCLVAALATGLLARWWAKRGHEG